MPQDMDSVDPTGIADGYIPADTQFTQEEDYDKLSASVTALYHHAHEHRLIFEREWELFRLYLKGEQLLLRDRETGDIVRLAHQDNKRLYSLNNQLRVAHRSLVGKMSRINPSFDVLPATMDYDERHGAEVAEAWLELFRRKQKMNIKFIEMNEQSSSTGTSCAQLYWDPGAGRRMAFCETCGSSAEEDMIGEPCASCQVQNEMEATQQNMGLMEKYAGEEQEFSALVQQGIMDPEIDQAPMMPEPMEPAPPPPMEPAFEGDVCTRVLDIRDVFIEPGVFDVEDFRYVIIRTVAPVTELRKRFPDYALQIDADGKLSTDRTAQLSYTSTDNGSASEYYNDHNYVYEYHEMPTTKYPKGRIVYIVNDIVVEHIDESPYYDLGRLPFYFFRWTLNAGEFWGESFIAQAWHRQKELNHIETIQREYAELISRPKIMNPIGNRVTADEITATTGQMIGYNAAVGPPEPMILPTLPVEVFNRSVQLGSDIRMQAAITENEFGMTPTDPNGRAMAIIEAEADQQLGPITQRNLEEWRSLHSGALLLAKDHYSPERMFTVAGESHGAKTYSFEDMDLKAGWDLLIEPDDGLSKNRAVRLQQSMDMLNAGVFMEETPMGPMPDIKGFKDAAKITLPGTGPDTKGTEYAAAEGALKRLEQGEMPQPQIFDDAVIFEEVYRGWLRGPGRKPDADPNLVQLVTEIWMWYGELAMAGMPPGPFPGGPEGGGGQASQAGSDQSAPGGSTNNAGHVGTNQQGVAGEAEQQVGQADQAAEGAARGNAPHEG